MKDHVGALGPAPGGLLGTVQPFHCVAGEFVGSYLVDGTLPLKRSPTTQHNLHNTASRRQRLVDCISHDSNTTQHCELLGQDAGNEDDLACLDVNVYIYKLKMTYRTKIHLVFVHKFSRSPEFIHHSGGGKGSFFSFILSLAQLKLLPAIIHSRLLSLYVLRACYCSLTRPLALRVALKRCVCVDT